MASDASGSGDLQFEKAEYEGRRPGELSCVSCKLPIGGTYYTAGENAVCVLCRDQYERLITGGSGVGRMLAATALGIPAAVVGAAANYAVIAWTQTEFALVAIVIGLLVGGAVKMGSKGRGGLSYQLLAVGLTYLSITGSYVPVLFDAMREQAKKAESTGNTLETAPLAEKAGAPEQAAPAAGEASASEPDAAAAASAEAQVPPSGVQVVLAFGAILVFAMTMPFLAGLENIVGLFIIGIGLYEAWVMNRRAKVELEGPFELGSSRPASGAGVG